jgi:hypothetical protein
MVKALLSWLRIFFRCLDLCFLIQLTPSKKIQTIGIQFRLSLIEQNIYDGLGKILDMD